MNIAPNANCVTKLHCEIQLQKKLTIIDSKCADKQNTLRIKKAVNDLYDARLC